MQALRGVGGESNHWRTGIAKKYMQKNHYFEKIFRPQKKLLAAIQKQERKALGIAQAPPIESGEVEEPKDVRSVVGAEEGVEQRPFVGHGARGEAVRRHGKGTQETGERNGRGFEGSLRMPWAQIPVGYSPAQRIEWSPKKVI